MTTTSRSLFIAILLALGASAIYLPHLAKSPVYLAADEVVISLEGQAIATTGRDLSGRFMPLFFESDKTWYPPILVYAIALFVRLWGLSDAVVRLPMTIGGIADVVLMYFIGRELFKHEAFAIIAAVFLATTPAHFIHSRLAMDYLWPVPFLLGWLLCMLVYLRNHRRRVLLAAGLLLGVGFYSYVAALFVMPLYGLVTCVFLYRRRESFSRYAILAAGFVLPASLLLPWLVWHSTMISAMAMHYRFADEATTTVDAVRGFVDPRQMGAQFMSVYSSLMSPRFLFVGRSAPRLIVNTGITGVFLVALAGPALVGLWRTIRGRLGEPGLLLAWSFLAAPIAATLVNDPAGISRATEILPFGVLLAVAGLDNVNAAVPAGNHRRVFLALWIPTIWLCVAYHPFLPGAQGFIRASTIPIVVAGLAVLLKGIFAGRAQLLRAFIVAAVVLGATQLVYALIRNADVMIRVSTALLALIALAALLDDIKTRRIPPAVIGAIIGLISGQFLSFYVHDPALPRIPLVPATVVLVAVRALLGLAAVLAPLFVLAASTGHTARSSPRSGRTSLVVAAVAFAVVQVGYFYIDQFATFALRFVAACAILVGVVALAMRFARIEDKCALLRLLGAVASGTVALLQFGPFYVDYFNGYRTRSSQAFDGNMRGAFELVIDETHEHEVPAIYLDRLGAYGFGSYYWRFYVIKHGRQDLFTRTIWASFDPDRIRALPPGSLIVTGTGSGLRDALIEQMIENGDVKTTARIRELDGRHSIWVLERAG